MDTSTLYTLFSEHLQLASLEELGDKIRNEALAFLPFDFRGKDIFIYDFNWVKVKCEGSL